MRVRLTALQRDRLTALRLGRADADAVERSAASALDRMGLVSRGRDHDTDTYRVAPTRAGRAVADLIILAERRAMLDDGAVRVDPQCREVNGQYVTPWEEID